MSNEFGFNPGQILDTYLKLLHPECPFLFQRPRRTSKKFNIDCDNQLFEPTKVGKNLVGPMMKSLCKTLNLPTFTNHSIRSTGIVLLKQQGFGDSEIIEMKTGHKAAGSLEHYDPSNTVEKKSEMASALLLKRSATDPVDVDSSEYKENQPPVPKMPKFTEENTTHQMNDKAMILLYREQDLRKSDQAMLQTAMAHTIDMNTKLMNKTV